MVISLLLMVIIITPIFRIMSHDLPQAISEVDLGTNNQEEHVKKQLENKKREIQAQNDAYILEQMAVQMKSVAKEEMMEKYGVSIKSIDLSPIDMTTEIKSEEDLAEIQLTMVKSDVDEDEAVAVIQPVEIDVAKNDSDPPIKSFMIEQSMKSDLAEIWGVDEDRIVVHLEGGEDER